MMRALEPEMYELVFRLIKDRIPEPKPHRYGACRPRVSDEICFRGLFMRFVTGAAWETVEVFMDRQVSDTTLRARRDEWVNAGVFEDLMEHALAEYDRLIGIDCDNVIIDGSTQLGPGGGPETAAYWGSKGRLGFKWSCGVDARGVGIGFVVASGNRNDFPLLAPTLETITARQVTSKLGALHLDRGYGYPSIKTKLEPFDIGLVEVVWRNQPHEGRVPLVGFAQRWIVERTNAWLTNFRQLKINWDRKIEHRTAALNLAFAILSLYQIVDHLKANNLPLETIR